MKNYLIFALLISNMQLAAWAQCLSGPPPSPSSAVQRLWMKATWGDLLTPEGLGDTSKTFFSDPKTESLGKTILVVSNEWGPPGEEIKGEKARVLVGYESVGQIDSQLHFTPTKSTSAIKTGASYQLILVPTFAVMYAHDGKTIVEKKPTGCHIWQIENMHGPALEGKPWTTVNTAIRYVLEMRAKTKDPAIQKNADATIAKLLKTN
jgi:hypothetical protein